MNIIKKQFKYYSVILFAKCVWFMQRFAETKTGWFIPFLFFFSVFNDFFKSPQSYITFLPRISLCQSKARNYAACNLRASFYIRARIVPDVYKRSDSLRTPLCYRHVPPFFLSSRDYYRLKCNRHADGLCETVSFSIIPLVRFYLEFISRNAKPAGAPAPVEMSLARRAYIM